MTIESYHYLLILIRNEHFKNRISNTQLIASPLERETERENLPLKIILRNNELIISSDNK